MKHGDNVTWTQRNLFGDASATVPAVVATEPESVDREGRGLRECVGIKSGGKFRFVPVEDLNNGSGTTRKLETQKRRMGSSAGLRTAAGGAGREPQPAPAKPPRRSESRAVRPEPNSPSSRSVPETVAACDVLAIDFLNLLVRAYHVGKPTETHAVRSMWQSVAKCIRVCRPKIVVFALDGGHKTRSDMFPAYKAHRPPSEELLTRQKQLAEESMRIAGINAIRIDDWEADDVLASLATQHDNTVIVSSDKDLLAMSGRARIYHPWKDGEFVTAESKLGLSPGRVTDYLALCGDKSDGVPGVPGIGPKTSSTLIEKHKSLEGVLAAVAMSQVGGAAAKKLTDGRADALLSFDLIKLNERLQLPDLQPWHPTSGWQSALTDLSLGSVAAVIDSLVPYLGEGRESFSDSEDRSQHRVFRKAGCDSETMNMDVRDIWADPETGMVCIWELGRKAQSTDKKNPWKPGNNMRTAWQQGRDGEDLDVVLNAESAPATEAQTERTLF